ncbi:uncharacterized protein LOC144568747 [Carex rostrata]
MATQQPPLDLFTDKEREVASILLDVSSIVLESAPQVPFKWGKRRRRTEPPYQFKSELDRDEPVGPTSSDEQKKKEEETGSPATPLCFPNSSSEEQIVTPPVQQVKDKKPNCQKDRLKEKREQVAALIKEKADLNREFLELQEKFQRLCAMKFYLRDQNSKLLAQAEVRALNQLKPVVPTQSTNRNAKPQWAQPPPAIERRGLEIDLNEKPTDDVAVYVMEAALTCQSDRKEKAAKSAMARKRRLEIQRERRTSSVYKRPRVQ